MCVFLFLYHRVLERKRRSIATFSILRFESGIGKNIITYYRYPYIWGSKIGNVLLIFSYLGIANKKTPVTEDVCNTSIWPKHRF